MININYQVLLGPVTDSPASSLFYDKLESRLVLTDKKLLVPKDYDNIDKQLDSSDLVLIDMEQKPLNFSFNMGFFMQSVIDKNIPIRIFHNCSTYVDLRLERVSKEIDVEPIQFKNDEEGLEKITQAVNRFYAEENANNTLVYTTGQIAKICKVAPRTVSKWFDSGRLKGYRVPGSQDRRIPRDKFVQFLSENGMLEYIN